jgi:cytosine/adenosine deaminase-related metal-dependent hydrolase
MKLTADRIFDGFTWLEEDQVLITDDQGRILDIVHASLAGDDVLRLRGTLCPGFVNAHGHLELSHLKGVTERGTGLTGFLSQVIQQRGFEREQVIDAMTRADRDMYLQGIQAMGDICNTEDSIPVKAASRIRWYNFIEVLSSRDEGRAQRLAHYTAIRDRFRKDLRDFQDGTGFISASLSPHAPYSVSPLSFQDIDLATQGETVSLHNQESLAEDELFRYGSGPFLDFYRSIGMSESPIGRTGRSSLQSVLPYFNGAQRIILVHNTFTTAEDLVFADHMAGERGLSIHYCLCPNANLFIEGRMPPVPLLMAEGRALVIGTDSLASNDQLSIASEIGAILHAFPDVTLGQALKWATSNGAAALGFENEIGSFTRGHRPGIILLDDDLSVQRIC